METGKKRTWIPGLTVLLAALGLLCLLNTQITLYSDDYWYGTFYQGGLRSFLSEMKRHYLETNGRFYVHLIIPTVLLFGTKLFTVLSPALLALLYGLGAKFVDGRLSRGGVMMAAGLGIMCTLALNVEYLRMSLLWISAYFNYIFPLLMTMAALLLQRRSLEGRQGKWERAAGLLLALLAGAGTEQCGIVSIVMIWGTAILDAAFDRGEKRRRWDYPLFVLLGFLTILLAPGSWARVDRGVEGGILSFLTPSVFIRRFFDAMIYMVKYPSAVLIIAALQAMLGTACLRDKGLSRWLLGCFVFAAAQTVFYLLGWDRAGCVCYALGMLVPAALLLRRREGRPLALCLLGSLAANAMLIITTLNSERTAMIGVVCLIIPAVTLLLWVLNSPTRAGRVGAGAVIAAVLAACVIAYVPTLRGYMANKEITDESLRSVAESRETGVAYISMDTDIRYRCVNMHEGEYFYENFRKYYKMAPETRIVFTSNKWETAPIESSGGDEYIFPTLSDDTGLYFPIYFSITSGGGNPVFSWRDHSYTVYIRDECYRLEPGGRVCLTADDGSETELGDDFVMLLPFSETYTLIYCRAEQLTEYLGIMWIYDEAGGVYRILK